MPNVEIDGTNSTVKTNVLTSQSGTTITVPTGKVLTVTDAAGLTVNGVAPLTSIANDAVTTVKILDANVTTVKILDANVTTAKIANNAITLAKMAGGTDGQIITYDASGDPVQVGPGTSGQVLTSAGAGAPPTFAAAAGGGSDTSLSNLSATGENKVAQAWVNFNGVSFGVRDSFNVSSVTDNGTGEYVVNFTAAMANVNYATVAACICRVDDNYGIIASINSHSTSTLVRSLPATTTATGILTFDPRANIPRDSLDVMAVCFGD